MLNCHEMRTGQIYVCDVCGIELQVVKDCEDTGKTEEECRCTVPAEAACAFSCCGEELRLKSR
jgi:predicted RNA-binding protein with PUA domain